MMGVGSQSKPDPEAFAPICSSFPVPFPVEDTWTNHLRTLLQNAGVDRGSVGVDLSDSGSNSNSSNSDNTNNEDLASSNRKKEILSD